jgi:MFS family permease
LAATRKHRTARIAAASTIGTIIEWYDYNLFATASALVFPHLFFPHFSALAGTLASFATFFVAFVARPIGAAIFGHYGDRAGRKTTLLVTLLMMAISTIVIGILPPFSAFGIVAPILLVASRVVQGIALGGEWGGAVLLAMEHGPHNRRGLNGSLPQVGSPAGTLAASGAVAVFGLVTGTAFTSWGWRLPFLLSALLAAVGLFIRIRVSETPEFVKAEEEGKLLRSPLLTVIRESWGRIVLAMCSRIGVDVAFYTFTVYSLSYLSDYVKGVGHETGLVAVLVASGLEMCTIPLYGRLSDRVGRKPLMLAGIAVLGLWAFPLFWILHSGSPVFIVIGVSVGLAIGHGLAWSIMGVFFPELFKANVRYTGASLAFQFAGIFGGGPAPFIATLIAASSIGWEGVGLYVLAACVLSFVCCAAIPETRRRAGSVPRRAGRDRLKPTITTS